MPAMITHYALGKRVLADPAMPPMRHRDAFLIGVQGPDIFFFFRAYPWLIGKKGHPIGNEVHEVCPSKLIEGFRKALIELSPRHRAIAQSYVRGFLCHYAADRTIHPFVIAMQKTMKAKDPSFAVEENPYHYCIESALDTHILRRDMGRYVTSFPLKSLIPEKDVQRDDAIAALWHRVLKTTLGVDISEKLLCHLTEDMRHSMGWMTDRTLIKGHIFRFLERFQKKGAWYSALLRTTEVDWYDFTNRKHTAWQAVNGKETADFFDLCDRAVLLSVSLITAYDAGVDGKEMTQDIDFTGHPYSKEECTDETDCEL